MKTLLTILLIIGIISFSSAQRFIPKEFFNSELDLELKDATGLVIPGFKKLNSLNDSILGLQLSNQEWSLKKNDDFLVENFSGIQFRMPVTSLQFNSNMPVMIPDSTVSYTLRVKKMPFFNPLDSGRDYKPGFK